MDSSNSLHSTTRGHVALLVVLIGGVACSDGGRFVETVSSNGGVGDTLADASVEGTGGSSFLAINAGGAAPMQSTGGITNAAAGASSAASQTTADVGGSDSIGGVSSIGGNEATGGIQSVAGTGGNAASGGSQSVTGTGGSEATAGSQSGAGTGRNTSTIGAPSDASSGDADSPDGESGTQPPLIILSDDGGWCWFESPRALVVGNNLIVGSVASGYIDASRRGDIEAIVHDLSSGTTNIVELHDRLELDDHDSPSFLSRPDGRLLTLYSKHSAENDFYYRISQTNDPLQWGTERAYAPTAATNLTYSNIFRLSAENDRVYDFYRGLDATAKPSFAYSDDLGQSWSSGNVVINATTSPLQRPYVRYASNGRDSVHLVYTDGHPRDINNSLYHIYYQNGLLHLSDGTVVSSLTHGLEEPNEGTLIFQGDANNVAWVSDVVLDSAERPVTAYSVQVGSAGLPAGSGGDDLRYRYARWDGTRWNDYPLAFAGTRLYAGEDDYSGLVAIDPTEPSIVYLSTNANPTSGFPLISTADNARHYEIFRGQTTDGGQTWHFTALTQNSKLDNLRPIMPSGADAGTKVLLWLRGQYHAYTNYEQQVVADIWRDESEFDGDGGGGY